jgi:molybdenum cofactor guanylyltransferase
VISIGVVLAGGASSRMGRDKASLQLHGQSLLQRTLDCLLAAGVSTTLVSGGTSGPNVVPDISPLGGPVAGIHAVMAHVLADHQSFPRAAVLLLMPVDMPLMTARVLQTLLESLGPTDQAVHYRGQMLPCAIRVSHVLRDYLQAGFASVSAGHAISRHQTRGPSMRELLAFTGASVIEGKEVPETVFLNANRPQDWSLIQTLAGVQGKLI